MRRLLALPSSPHLVFLTVRELCPTAHLGFGHPVPDYAPQQKTVHSWAEASFEKLARHYGQSSLSYYHAIAPLFHANATNFTRADVAADCLHPSKGRRGSGYMASMLTNWLRAARRDVAAATRGARAAKRCATAAAPRQALNGKVYVVRRSLLWLCAARGDAHSSYLGHARVGTQYGRVGHGRVPAAATAAAASSIAPL